MGNFLKHKKIIVKKKNKRKAYGYVVRKARGGTISDKMESSEMNLGMIKREWRCVTVNIRRIVSLGLLMLNNGKM